jgi:hypothetical protein
MISAERHQARMINTILSLDTRGRCSGLGARWSPKQITISFGHLREGYCIVTFPLIVNLMHGTWGEGLSLLQWSNWNIAAI